MFRAHLWYIPAMKRFAALLLALTACQNESKLDGKTSGDLDARVKKLEADNAKYKEELEWLNGIYKQQKQQADAQEREEPAPDAIFAVDIATDLSAGQVEGPANAPITIVDA